MSLNWYESCDALDNTMWEAPGPYTDEPGSPEFLFRVGQVLQDSKVKYVDWSDYTIVTKTSECYGHGSYGEETRICGTSPWGGGAFPPCFLTKEAAEVHMATMEGCSRREVVELQLHTPSDAATYAAAGADASLAFLLFGSQGTLPSTDTPPTKETP